VRGCLLYWAAEMGGKADRQVWYLVFVAGLVAGPLVLRRRMLEAAEATARLEGGGGADTLAAADGYTLAQSAVLIASLVMFAVGMEYYARFAHREWWHGEDSLWFIHRSHHTKRTGMFEANDVFGIANGAFVMPFLLQAWWARPNMCVALRLGATMGISAFGTLYIIVHDGVHHQRFWCGPLRRVRWFREIARAHAQHHTKEHTPPFGLFLGPQELAAIDAGDTVPGMPLVLRAGLCLWLAALGATIGSDQSLWGGQVLADPVFA
jgi:beta-carotene 3-hydroxylase